MLCHTEMEEPEYYSEEQEEQEGFALEQQTTYSNSPTGIYEKPILDSYSMPTSAQTAAALVSFPATVRRPSLEDFAGPYNFEIQLSSKFMESWHYSNILKRLFVDIGKTVCFDVTLNAQWVDNQFFVRALPVFLSESESYEEVVKRCPAHEDRSDPLNHCFTAVEHVIRTANPHPDYQTDHESGRHSVVVPLAAPQPGTSSVPFMYSFVCRQSCSGGIARRALGVVFTLESVTGEILGRRVLEVRVCSCPGRDKQKLERAFLRNQQTVQTALQEQCDHTQESASISSEANGDVKVPEHLSSALVELKVLPQHLSEIRRQALSILWRDFCENNQTSLSDQDAALLKIYRGET